MAEDEAQQDQVSGKNDITRTRIFLATEVVEAQEDFFDRMWASVRDEKSDQPITWDEL